MGVWQDHIQAKDGELNIFREPLPETEVRAIAKSVANWVWQHMRQDSDKFLKRQAVKGKKGGIASGQSRKSKANNHRIAAQALKDLGTPLSELARELDLSQSTITKGKSE